LVKTHGPECGEEIAVQRAPVQHAGALTQRRVIWLAPVDQPPLDVVAKRLASCFYALPFELAKWGTPTKSDLPSAQGRFPANALTPCSSAPALDRLAVEGIPVVLVEGGADPVSVLGRAGPPQHSPTPRRARNT
jgi:hypothetical protein